MEKYKAMRLKAEMWDGSNPAGKTIVVQEEQGFGDTLQMLRFIPMLKERGANVLAYVRPELYALLEGWDGASQVVSWNPADKTVPADVDYICGIMDLPGHLGITLANLPAKVPYIPNPKKGDPKYKLEGEGLKIGLVWSGNPAHKRNFARSYPFELLKDITALQGFTFYGLQFKPDQKATTLMKQFGVINLAPKINTLADSAATLAELDLLITVDSAPAHLAGALGLPCWTLLTVDADWRYLLGRDDSPWYPSMRLFRQKVSGDWEPVLQEVQEALISFQNSKQK
jgi:ADP-heptose:LPS heptosyltransferase